MTYQEACRLFEISSEASISDIKKKYRALMHIYHPDSNSGNKRENLYILKR